jgi:Tfp pilus assembly protein FimT
MTLLVAGILFGIGVPNVLEFQRNGAMTAAANDLVTAVLMARTEAVKRQAPVTLCLSADPLAANPACSPNQVADFAGGYIVFVDENGNLDANGARILTDATDGNAAINNSEPILSRTVAPGGTVRISTNCGYVTFGPSGFTQTAPGLCFPNNRAFLTCDDRGRRAAAGSLSSARVVRIDRPGRAQVLRETAQVNAFIGALALAGVTATCP